MTDTDLLSLLSDAALRKRSGAAVFGRGQTYASSGAVEILEDAAPEAMPQAGVEAKVHGTQAYLVRVWIDGKNQLGGICNCPHAQEGNFCKHLVALCMTWRGMLGGEAPEHDEAAARKVAAAAKRAKTQAENRAALRSFLQAQSTEALAERLWSWAEGDRNLMADLKAWLAEHKAGGDVKALCGAISKVLRHRGSYLEWHAVPAYFRRASRVLPMLQPWLQRDPRVLLELCEHALRELGKVQADAEDNGQLSGLMADLTNLLLQALRASPPPASWTDRWFQHLEEDLWAGGSERAVLGAAGPAVQARYAERARTDWAHWLREHPTPRGNYDGDRSRLRRRYLDSVRRRQEPRALYDAMAESVYEVGEFHDLVELCEEEGWLRDANHWAQEAFKRHPDSRWAQDDLLRCYARDGRNEEALAIWRGRLEERPDADRYLATLEAAVRAGRDRQAYRAEILAWMEQREGKMMEARRKDSWRPADVLRRDVTLRVECLLTDGDLDAALSVVRQDGAACDPSAFEALAMKLPADQHAIAAELLRKVFDYHMKVASSPYAKPLDLAHAILDRLAPEEAAAWQADLRARYKAKRTFIAGLPPMPDAR